MMAPVVRYKLILQPVRFATQGGLLIIVNFADHSINVKKRKNYQMASSRTFNQFRHKSLEGGNLELNPEKRSRLARRDRTVVSGSTLPGKVIIFFVFVKHWIKRTPENCCRGPRVI